MKGYTFVNGAYIVSPNNAPAVLQQLLQATYGPTVTVENDGVIGATLGERINGYVLYSEAFSTALQSMTAQIVIENFAANDVYSNNQETPTSFEGYLLDFVTEAQAAGKTVVLEEPNPFTAPEYANMPQYVAIIDNVAAQLNLPLVKQYDYIQTLPNWQSLLSDGGHPTDALYAIKAQREYDVVAPIVSSMMQP